MAANAAPTVFSDYSPASYPTFCETLTARVGKYELAGVGISFVVSTILTLNPIAGILGAGLSFLSARIDRIVTPLFQKHFGEWMDQNIGGECGRFLKFLTKTFVVLTLANLALGALAPVIGVAIEISILFSLILSVIISLRALISTHANPWAQAPEGRFYLGVFA